MNTGSLLILLGITMLLCAVEVLSASSFISSSNSTSTDVDLYHGPQLKCTHDNCGCMDNCKTSTNVTCTSQDTALVSIKMACGSKLIDLGDFSVTVEQFVGILLNVIIGGGCASSPSNCVNCPGLITGGYLSILSKQSAEWSCCTAKKGSNSPPNCSNNNNNQCVQYCSQGSTSHNSTGCQQTGCCSGMCSS